MTSTTTSPADDVEPDEADGDGRHRSARLPGGLVSLGWALVLAVLMFPEIFFGGGSFSTVPLDPAVGQSTHPVTVTIVPNLDDRLPTSGIVDLGARNWQFEPTIRYMANVLRDGSNPDWNPYLNAGSLGPETLDGMQLSPLVLVVAALGGSSSAFTVGLMALIMLAMYCLLQFFDRTLDLHRVAGIGACVAFLLSGWATSTLTDVTCVPYLMLPIVLYAVTELQRRTGPARFLLAVAAYAGLGASTFSPGQAIDVIFITVVASVVDVWRRRDQETGTPLGRRVATEVGRQAVVPAVALAVTAVIVLPALDAYRHGGADVATYSRQVLATLSPSRWLLLPTWVIQPLESLQATRRFVSYLGLAPIIFTAAAWPRVRDRSRWLLGATSLLVVVGVSQEMGVPGLKLLGELPGLRAIINPYWASLAAAALALGFGVAVDTAVRRGLSLGVVLVLVGAAMAVITLAALRATGPDVEHLATVAVVTVAIVLGCVLAVSWAGERGLIRPSWLGALTVLVVAAELGAYANHTRTRRADSQDPPARYIQYLQHHVGEGRVLDMGRTTMLGDWAAAFGIREVGSSDIMQIPAYRAFYQRYLYERSGHFLQMDRTAAMPFTADHGALDLLSVRYIVLSDIDRPAIRQVSKTYPLAYHDATAQVSVFANPDARPRAQLVPALAPGPHAVYGGGLLTPTTVAHTEDRTLLAEAAGAGISHRAGAPRPTSAARITQDNSTRVTVAVDAPAPSVLVLADSYQSNWHVTVDGRPAHVGPVDEVARGVVVPAGRSVVVFRYHSTARTLGWLITLVTVVALVVGCGLWAWRRRHRADRQSVAPAL